MNMPYWMMKCEASDVWLSCAVKTLKSWGLQHLLSNIHLTLAATDRIRELQANFIELP